MDYKKVGKVVHYFDKIQVAVVNATDDVVNVGDTLRYGEEGGVELSVESIQIDHEQVQTIPKGKEGAVKVDGTVKSGDFVYKVS